MKKKCSKCKILKIKRDFYKDSGNKTGRRSSCISCDKIIMKEYRQKSHVKSKRLKYALEYYSKNKQKCLNSRKKYHHDNKHKPEYQNKKHKQNIMYKFNVSSDQYNKLMLKSICEICLNPNINNKRLNIDHCHVTNQVRGVLCDLCNKGLGHFKDDIDLFIKAIKYLKKVKNNVL